MHAPDTYACSHKLAGRVPQGAGPEPGSYSDYLHFAELKALPQPRTQERPNCQRAAGARPGLGAVESTVRDDGEAMIGTVASGTGGTNGFHCLRPRGQTRFYPFLHEATSLVHRHRAMAS